MRMLRLLYCWLILIPVLLVPASAFGQTRLTWSFGYGDLTPTNTNYGFSDPTDGTLRQQTVTAAANYLSNSILDGRGTIIFNWRASSNVFTPNTLASAGTWFSWATPPPTPTAIVGDVYRQAMGNLTPTDEAGFGQVFFNQGSNSWYAVGLGSGTPTSTQYDLLSVVQHEMTHALHFASAIKADGSSNNADGMYNRFDTFLYKSAAGTDRLLNATNSGLSGTVADLTSNSIYWGGEFGVAANGGNRIKMYAPSTFQPGTSLSHLDASGATASLMMSPNLDPGQTKRQYSGIEIGMLLDLGWNNYEWSNVSGSWSEGANVAAGVGVSKWQNSIITNETDPANRKVFAPVGEVTHNMVLTFGGSGSTAYTSVNDLPASPFKLNRLRLDSSASVTNSIAGNPLEMSNDNGFDVTPMIEQKNTGAFIVANNIAIPKGLIVGGAGSGQITLNGALSGAGFLTKTGGSTLVLGGANTYGGVTTITGGTIQVAPGGVIPGNVANAGTLQFSPTGTVNYAGVISGTGNFIKDGAGSVTLTGANTYTGTTAINAGTLRVDGQLGASAITVATGATLAGSGQLGNGTAGSLTVQSGATLRPGDGASVATMTLNSNQAASLAGGSTLRIAVGNSPTTGSKFHTLGAANIDLSGLLTSNKLNIALFAVDALQLGVKYTLTLLGTDGTGNILYPGGTFDANQFNVTTSNINFDTAGYTLVGTSTAVTISFTPIPEPATVFAVGAAGLGALGLIRRYRRSRSGTLAA